MPRRIFISTALPYANGDIHLGPPGRVHTGRHLGALPADAGEYRALRMRGRRAWDADHAARGERRRHTRAIDRAHARRAPARLHGFRSRASTTITRRTARRNRALAESIYARLQQADMIATREIEQFYDPVKEMFLAGPLHQGRVPEVRREGPVRGQLARSAAPSMRRPTSGTPIPWSPARPRCASARSTTSSVSQTTAPPTFCASGCREPIPTGRAGCPGGHEQGGGMAGRER